jgi:peptidoglycan L-alanyl-D-glutamate endopeptidase CwlK
MAQDRNIENAVPALRAAWKVVQANWAKLHGSAVRPILVEVHRSAETQRAYYAQGRKPLWQVNRLRTEAKLPPLSEEQNRRVITYRQEGTSKHEAFPSKAIDILIMNGAAIVNDPREYRKLADIIRGHNPDITWGGDWDGDQRMDDERFVDMPHFEF